jgi:peptidoglycan hydrolase CwlO-like protein
MMKKIILSLLLAAPMVVFAQKKIEVNETNDNLGGGNHPALSVMAYVKDGDKLMKAFKDKMKDFDAKVSSKKELFADNATWKAFGPNTFDAYAKVEEVKGEGFKLIVAVDMGGAWMSGGSHGEQTRLFKNLLKELAVKVSKEEVEDEVKAQEKLMEKMMDQQKDLESKNKDLHGDIENYKKKIAEAESDIKTNEENQKKKKEEIEKQKEAVKIVKEKLSKIE